MLKPPTSSMLRQLFYGIGIPHLIWMVLSYAFLMIRPLIPQNKIAHDFSFLLSTTTFMLLALALMVLTIIREIPFQKSPRHRSQSILTILIIEWCVVMSIYMWDLKTNFLFMLHTVNLLLLAIWIGTWLSSEVNRPPEIVLLCIAMSIADLFSVYAGPTKHIASSMKRFYEGGMIGRVPIGDLLMVKVPAPLVSKMLPVTGVVDWIIVAFLAGTVAKFKINENIMGEGLDLMIEKKRNTVYLPISFLGLLAAILCAQVFNLILPALPIISLFFLSFILFKYPQTRLHQKSDRVLMLKFVLAMMFCFVILKFWL